MHQRTVDTLSGGVSFYGHQLPQHQQQQQTGGSLLHQRHHGNHHQPQQYQHHHQKRATTVRDTFQVGCHDDHGDAIPQFTSAAGRHVVPGTGLHQRGQQPGTGFTGSHELVAERACVDRYDCVLFGCEQFAKISFNSRRLFHIACFLGPISVLLCLECYKRP